jgi:hypothetical protein
VHLPHRGRGTFFPRLGRRRGRRGAATPTRPKGSGRVIVMAVIRLESLRKPFKTRRKAPRPHRRSCTTRSCPPSSGGARRDDRPPPRMGAWRSRAHRATRWRSTSLLSGPCAARASTRAAPARRARLRTRLTPRRGGRPGEARAIPEWFAYWLEEVVWAVAPPPRLAEDAVSQVRRETALEVAELFVHCERAVRGVTRVGGAGWGGRSAPVSADFRGAMSDGARRARFEAARAYLERHLFTTHRLSAAIRALWHDKVRSGVFPQAPRWPASPCFPWLLAVNVRLLLLSTRGSPSFSRSTPPPSRSISASSARCRPPRATTPETCSCRSGKYEAPYGTKQRGVYTAPGVMCRAARAARRVSGATRAGSAGARTCAACWRGNRRTSGCRIARCSTGAAGLPGTRRPRSLQIDLSHTRSYSSSLSLSLALVPSRTAVRGG